MNAILDFIKINDKTIECYFNKRDYILHSIDKGIVIFVRFIGDKVDIDCYDNLLSAIAPIKEHYNNFCANGSLDEILTALMAVILNERQNRELSIKVSEWCQKEYAYDLYSYLINQSVTFRDVLIALDERKDVYKLLEVGDSTIRERIFNKLAKIMGIDYNDIYDKWVKSDD